MNRPPFHWPAYYPERCPPSDAIAADGPFYRYASSFPPRADDALPHLIVYPQRQYDEPCRAAGLSMFARKCDLLKIAKLVPAERRSIVVAVHLRPIDGLMKHTPPPRLRSSHHTWWVPIDVDANSVQMELDELNEDTA